MIEESYDKYLERKAAEYETLCRHCGACCGVFENDPCVKLVSNADGRYFCSDYKNRIGLQKTVNGNVFKCVSFRQIRDGSWAGSWRCGYKKL